MVYRLSTVTSSPLWMVAQDPRIAFDGAEDVDIRNQSAFIPYRCGSRSVGQGQGLALGPQADGARIDDTARIVLYFDVDADVEIDLFSPGVGR